MEAPAISLNFSPLRNGNEVAEEQYTLTLARLWFQPEVSAFFISAGISIHFAVIPSANSALKTLPTSLTPARFWVRALDIDYLLKQIDRTFSVCRQWRQASALPAKTFARR